jgi:riboflavin kinase/FMN adenylyltransferase
MDIVSTVDLLDAQAPPIYWAMGTFDGLHIGHQEVIRRAVIGAHDQGALAGVLTFDRHPLSMLCPERAPKTILSGDEEKWNLLQQMGVDVVLDLPFTPELAALEPIPFLEMIRQAHPMVGISVGVDWRFGAKRHGDTACLTTWCQSNSIPCLPVAPVELDGQRVSSTLIRSLIQAGEVETAQRYLGCPVTLSGVVVHGRQLARTLGFPTANVVPKNGAIPPRGVYAVKLMVDGTLCFGVANLGVRPTVEGGDGADLLLEVHIIDWEGDLYGRWLHVELLRFIRPEQKFGSLDQLKEAITRDHETVRSLMASWT